MRIAFLLPSLALGGGNIVVTQIARDLIGLGHEVFLVTCYEVDGATLRASVEGEVPSANIGDIEGEFDVAIATFWSTVYELHRIQASTYVYFVQSLEHRFSRKTEWLNRGAALNTYKLGLPIITIADWIATWLRTIAPSSEVEVVRYGVDHSIFNPKPLPPPYPFRLLVEGGVDTAIKNTRLALDLAIESAADEVWLLASRGVEAVEGVDRIFSGLSRDGVAEVMEQCHALLKLSLVEGQPLPPVEMALMGRPSILSRLDAYLEYLEPGRSAIVVEEPFREAGLEAVAELKQNPDRLAAMGAAARASVASWPDFDASARSFEAALLRYHAPAGRGAVGVRRVGTAQSPLDWLHRTSALASLYGIDSRPVPYRMIRRVARKLDSLLQGGSPQQPRMRDYVESGG